MSDVVPGEAKIANISFNMDFTWLQREPLKHSCSAELGLQARNQKLSSNQPSLCFPKDYFIFTEEIRSKASPRAFDSLSVSCSLRLQQASFPSGCSQSGPYRGAEKPTLYFLLSHSSYWSVRDLYQFFNKPKTQTLILALKALCYQPVT